MAQDRSEKIDEYCTENYGHTNWGYKSTYTKDELNSAGHDIEDKIVFWHEPIDPGSSLSGLGTFPRYLTTGF